MGEETNRHGDLEIDQGVSSSDLQDQLTNLLGADSGQPDENIDKKEIVDDNLDESEDLKEDESTLQDEDGATDDVDDSTRDEEVHTQDDVFSFEIEGEDAIELSLDQVRNSAQLREFMLENEFKTVDEARSAVLKNADYTQKTQLLADRNKKLDEDATRYTEGLDSLAQNLEVALGITQADMKPFEGVDWTALRESDPISFEDKYPAYLAARQRSEQVEDIIRQTVTSSQEHNAKMSQEHAENEAKQLSMKLPDFADPVKAKAQGEAMRAFLQGDSIGFKANEINIKDHREVLIIQKAMAYDRLMADKATAQSKKVTRSPKKVVKAGSLTNKSTATQQRKAQNKTRLKESGGKSTAAAMAALSDLI